MKKRISMIIALVFLFVNVMQAITFGQANNSSPQTMDPNSTEYQQWKENYVKNSVIDSVYNQPDGSNSVYSSASSRQILMRSLAVSNVLGNTLSNDFLQFAIGSNGRYTIGTTGGNPDNSNDDYKKNAIWSSESRYIIYYIKN